MGVYIKNMVPPPSCCQCPVNTEVCKKEYKYLLTHPELYNKRADDCPLIEIPEPHGDLIDRRVLLEGEGQYSISLCKKGIDVEEILRAKTVIPASEED